ncbi:YjgN family protein [Hyphomicrobium sp.]|uniref:YjgN family protein n=1 Tax=Hyphomicrobium sp. TaxID=82 RepID=UPI002E3059C8|nr:DUF898 family protein [Hyphomicrobium sp.]HEX2843370.1 DUF898 family protein [Hyphomicrobium sp.]
MNDDSASGADKRPDSVTGSSAPAAAPQWLTPAPAEPGQGPAVPPVPRDHGGYAHSQGFSRNYVPPAGHAPPPGYPPPAGATQPYAQLGYAAPGGYAAAPPGYPPYGAPVAYAPPPIHVNPPVRLTYDGKLGELYLVYLRSLLLTLVTLGVYRFWGRTRVRRYLWSHFQAFGDRFEYRGRGIELFLGFLAGVGFLMVVGGIVLGALWLFARETVLQEVDAGDAATWLLLLAGYPLLAVGRYAGLRYKLTRTRWRGIRSGLDGSAWKFGGISVGLGLLNAMSAQLVTPILDVALAKYRLKNLTFGTVRFGFAGQAGDIYGRFIGFYFLNIMAWIVLVVIIVMIIGGLSAVIDRFGGWEAIGDKIAHPTPLVIVIMILVALAVYSLIGLVILPLRCWYQAYLLRYLISRTWFGRMQFVSGVTTGQMWGFIVLNWIILVFTFGIGWPWVLHRTARLIADQLWIYGEVDALAVAQALGQGPAIGEGLLDLFDTGIV